MPRGWERPGGRIGGTTPSAAVGADQTQVAHVVGSADGREVFELLVDVALPEIGRLEDVHVAVEDFETVIGHRITSNVQTFNSFKPTDNLCNRPKYVLNDLNGLNILNAIILIRMR